MLVLVLVRCGGPGIRIYSPVDFDFLGLVRVVVGLGGAAVKTKMVIHGGLGLVRRAGHSNLQPSGF